MKLFINLIFISAIAHANQVVIYSTNGPKAAMAVQKRLVSEHLIPEALITSYLVDKCPVDLKKGRALYLCANKKELEVLNSSSSDIESIIESLTVFKSEV